MGISPGQFALLLKEETVKWAKVMKKAGIRVD